MYSNFVLASVHSFDKQQLNFQKCIIGGNWTMIFSLCITVLCLMINFKFDHNFSIAAQVAAHIATIVFAGFLKIGYVVRCVGIHGLGYKIF